MLRYHGVLAGNGNVRAELVPGREPVAEEQPLLLPAHGGPLAPPPRVRHPWAWLLRRVLAIDMARCPQRDGRVCPLDVVTDAADIACVLGGPGAFSGGLRGPRLRRPRPDSRPLDFCAA